MQIETTETSPPMEVAKRTPIITRVFTERDEIRLLRCMIKYKSERGCAASSDFTAFTDYVNPYLSFHATKSQVARKIGRLSKKYSNNLKREVNGKKPINYSNKHQRMLYRLSEKIWLSQVFHEHSSDDDEGVADQN